MQYGTDIGWTRWVDSRNPFPEAHPLGNLRYTLGELQKLSKKITIEQEVFICMYFSLFCLKEPGSWDSVSIEEGEITSWIKYFRKKGLRFSKILYYLIAYDFYEKEPMMKAAKQLITAFALQLPTETIKSYNIYLGLVQTLSNGIAVLYMPKMLDHIRNIMIKPRVLFNQENPSKEADIFLGVQEALNVIVKRDR